MPIVVDKGIRGTKLPRLEGENADVFPGSSLAVLGLWIYILRARFAPDTYHVLPWIWAEDLRAEDDQDGDPLPDGSPRKIQIESAYNTEKQPRDYYPSVYVGRSGGAITVQQTAVGDYVGEHRPTKYQAYHAFAGMPLTFECEAETSGEAQTIGDILWSFVLCTRQICREEFGFQAISHPVLSDVEPFERSKSLWRVSVQFQVSFDMRWTTLPHDPVLRDVSATLRGRKNAEGYLTSLVGKV
jgi:hypothetical protein